MTGTGRAALLPDEFQIAIVQYNDLDLVVACLALLLLLFFATFGFLCLVGVGDV